MLKKIIYRIARIHKLKRFRKKKLIEGTKISRKSKGYLNVIFDGKNGVPDYCNFSGNIQIGYATTLGFNNLISGNISFGKYCQIGADVGIHSTNHPVSFLSTYINKNLFNGELKKLKEIKKITIGNDVWIGHNAIIVGEVNVGNGAIIAAGSVVTKDIPPFSIVAGVPAKVIKKRFSNDIINEIEFLKWWDFSKEELIQIKNLFFKDLNKINSIYDDYNS